MRSTGRPPKTRRRQSKDQAPSRQSLRGPVQGPVRGPVQEPVRGRVQEPAGRGDSGAETGAAGAALTEELAQTFFELLIRHRAGFRDVLGQTGLSVTQLHVLQNLGEGAMTMRELASASFCEPSALTGIVDKLESLGFLSRRASTEDRRSKQVSLTRSGAAFRRRLLDRFKEPAPWMAALSPEDQLQLLAILRRAVALAQPVEPGTEFSLTRPAPAAGAPASSRSTGRAPSRASSRSSSKPSAGTPSRPKKRRPGS